MGERPKLLDALEEWGSGVCAGGSAGGVPVGLIRMERLAAAEEMAAEVAHAINNPLAVLIGRLQMRLERTSQPDDEVLLALARRIERTVAGMLELSNRSALQPTETSVPELLEDALRPLASRLARVKLATFVDPLVGTLFVDRVLVVRALQDVLTNALDAMPAGGELRIEVEELDGAGALLIGVGDTGCGMDAEIRDAALDPFFTTKPGHTGLGLTLANRIVVGHGGRLCVRSAERHGTVVSLELPVRRGARRPRSASPEALQ